MQFTRRVRVMFGGMSGLVLAFLYLPLLIIVRHPETRPSDCTVNRTFTVPWKRLCGLSLSNIPRPIKTGAAERSAAGAAVAGV